MALQHHHNDTSTTFHSKTVIFAQVYYSRLQFPTITSTVQGLIAKLIMAMSTRRNANRQDVSRKGICNVIHGSLHTSNNIKHSALVVNLTSQST